MPSIARRSRQFVITVVALALVVAACSSTGNPAPTTGPAASAPAATPAVTSSSPAASASSSGSAADARLIVGKAGEPGLHVILASNRESVYDLPSGVPDATWGQLVTATTDGTTTTVTDLTVQPGYGGRSQSLPGAWRLPTIGTDPVPTGVSIDGATIVLVPDRPYDATEASSSGLVSRFAILRRTLDADPRVIALHGDYEFDAISIDGSILYVVEHLPSPPEAHYQVRAVDVSTGTLREGVIVDKANIDEAMGGWPIAQIRTATGFVFTLYRSPEHPFIHALNTTEGWALCIDLPATGASDPAGSLDWGIAAAADGRTIVAANATLGLVASFYDGDYTPRTASFAPTAATGIVLAKSGDDASGAAAGHRVVTAKDGSIYAAGATGVVRLSGSDLTVAGWLVPGSAVDAIALSPDGSTLYALIRSGGRIVEVDVASGRIVGEVPGYGFDRLVAVYPG
jgi:hypothetical protein